VSSTSSSVRTAVTSVAIGAASGGAIVTGILIAAYGMPRGPQTPFANLVIGGAAASLAVAAFVGFVCARRLSAWRALLVAIIAVSGAALFTVLTTVADMALGRTGLLVLAVICAVVIAAAAKLRPAADAPA
jgi:hypothetical protein